MGYSRLIQSGSLLEVYEYDNDLPTNHGKRKNKTKRPSSITSSITSPSIRRPDSIRRASKSFRRLIRANLIPDSPPSLLTLTMFETVSLAASIQLFRRFIAKLRYIHGPEFRYIAVPEAQKRGAIHFHVMLWGLNETAQTEYSTRHFARLWLRGFCDAIVTDGHPKLVWYLSKYLQKQMSDIRQGRQKAYYTSWNIVRPMSVAHRTQVFRDIIEKEVIPSSKDGEAIKPVFEVEYITSWLGRCRYKIYESIEKYHESNSNVKTPRNYI